MVRRGFVQVAVGTVLSWFGFGERPEQFILDLPKDEWQAAKDFLRIAFADRYQGEPGPTDAEPGINVDHFAGMVRWYLKDAQVKGKATGGELVVYFVPGDEVMRFHLEKRQDDKPFSILAYPTEESPREKFKDWLHGRLPRGKTADWQPEAAMER